MLSLVSRSACILLAASVPLWTHAIDIPPGQAVAPPPGKSALRIEMNSVKYGEKYNEGESLKLGPELQMETIGAQYSGSLMIKNRLAGFYINSSVGRATPGGSLAGLEKERGLTDSAAALVTWLHNDKVKGRYVVLGTFVIVPTGDYDSSRLLNFGQNRFSGGFQLGGHTRLAEKWDLMMTSDVMFSSENNDYRLTHQSYEQKPLYSLQTTLMHHIDPSLMLSATYYLYAGGEGELDGVSMNDSIRRNRYELVLSKRFKSAKYFLYFGKDANTENGFIEDRRLSLRYQHYF